MNAKRLPSGMWRARAYSHKDADGKEHMISFTAPTKAEAEMKATQYAARRKHFARLDLTVSEALDGYITAKEGVLSPSTIRSYDQMRRTKYESIKNKKIRSLTSEDIQLYISDLSRKASPKTVRNVYGFLVSALALYQPDVRYRVTLPQKQKKRPVSPSDDVVARLYEAAEEKMRICIALGCRSLRRGEIAALKYEDIQDGLAHIHSDMVRDKDGKWIYKEMPKTSESDRFVRVPDLGEGEGFIVGMSPDMITKNFIKLRNSLNLEIRFHDLRHYFASTAVVLNIPELYSAQMGGWVNGGKSVMKSVYQNKIMSMSDFYSDKMESHISDVLEKQRKTT